MTVPNEYKVEIKTKPLHALVRVPGSKSIANRALICASLSRGTSVISGLPEGDDTSAMLESLRVFGSQIVLNDSTARVESPVDLESKEPIVIHARLAGTTARFLTALGCLRAGEVTVDGEEQLRSRPMADLHVALADIGASVTWDKQRNHLPVTVKKGDTTSTGVQIAANTSSQFVTALMLIAPMLQDGLQIALQGDIISQPYIAMTASVMKSFGAVVNVVDGRNIWVRGGGYVGCEYEIEPDASSASYAFAAAAVVGGSVTVSAAKEDMLQGDIRFVEILEQMGCDVSNGINGITVTRSAKSDLKGIDCEMSHISDLVPTLAIVAMFASTPSRIRNVGFIRNKESDRIGDLACEMRKLGANVVEHSDGLEIFPSILHGGRCDTHHDHRLAMAFGVAGLRIDGVVVVAPAVVRKSWPDFWEMLENLQ